MAWLLKQSRSDDMYVHYPGYKGIMVRGYEVTRLHRYKGTRVLGYGDARMRGYKGTRVLSVAPWKCLSNGSGFN